jgi:hypothetical protein
VRGNLTTASAMTSQPVTGLTLSGNQLSTDPQFVDTAAHDFHLRSTSPAIDTGIPESNPFDHAGCSRPQGAAYDIGAYES